MKVLLVCDRKNWAYDAIARELTKQNEIKARDGKATGLEFRIFYLKQQEGQLEAEAGKADRVFFMGKYNIRHLGDIGFDLGISRII